jgi:ribokinase
MKRLKKVIVFGSINMDLVVSVSNFPKPGETILGKQHHWFPGGKGANQAVAIRRLGGDVSMVGKIGDDYLGQTAVDILHNENINTASIKSIKDVSTGLAIIQVDGYGQNTIVVSSGANEIWPETEATISRLLEGHDLAVFQLEIPIPTAAKIICQAKKMGLYTILNAAPANADILPVLSEIDLLIINETETALLSGKETINQENIREAVIQLAERGPSDIIVTLGEAGCLVFTGGNFYVIPSYRVDAVDTTAAGDTFVGAVVTRLGENAGIIDAARLASAAGALTVTRLGAQSSIPKREEVDEFIKTHDLNCKLDIKLD